VSTRVTDAALYGVLLARDGGRGMRYYCENLYPHLTAGSGQVKLSKTQKKRLKEKKRAAKDVEEEERRPANDGGLYTHAEFFDFFGDEGQWWWDHAHQEEVSPMSSTPDCFEMKPSC
jgi:hypothetical protein